MYVQQAHTLSLSACSVKQCKLREKCVLGWFCCWRCLDRFDPTWRMT